MKRITFLICVLFYSFSCFAKQDLDSTLINISWEYAAKGGPEQKNYMYAGSNVLDEVALYRYYSIVSDCRYNYTNSKDEAQPVGTKKANTLGIYDMTGLSSEICYDDVSLSSGEYCNPIGISLNSTRGGTCYSYHDKSSLYVFGEYSTICTIRVAQNAQ